jgi:hypothetical protein
MSNTVNENVRIEEPAQNEIDEHYGTVSISKDRVTTGAYETWEITYTVGDITLDDGAKIKIATNQTSDWGRPQFETQPLKTTQPSKRIVMRLLRGDSTGTINSLVPGTTTSLSTSTTGISKAGR